MHGCTRTLYKTFPYTTNLLQIFIKTSWQIHTIMFMENAFKCKYDYWIELKTLWRKWAISPVSCLLLMCQNIPGSGKGFKFNSTTIKISLFTCYSVTQGANIILYQKSLIWFQDDYCNNCLTLSLIRQFCSRQLWTYFVKT